MKAKLCSLTSTILLALMSPASAGWVYYGNTRYYQPDGSLLGATIGIVISIAIAVPIIRAMIPAPKPPPRAKTADEYNAEAILLAAKRHHTEMTTELRMAEIEAARVEAIHKERNEIIAHDKKVRELNARLDEKRRSS